VCVKLISLAVDVVVGDLVDSFGNTFVVTYNMDTLNPKLTDGWKDLEKIYTEQIVDSYVQFCYVENCQFQITCFVGKCEPQNKESFLLGVVTHPRTALYVVKLTKSQAQASHLVVTDSSF